MTPSAPAAGGVSDRNGRPRTVWLFAPGLLLGAVVMVVWLWPAGDAGSTSAASPTPTATVTPSPTPTPDPTPEENPPPMPDERPEPDDPPDSEGVSIALNAQYVDETFSFAYLGMGEEAGKPFALLVFGPPPDGPRVRLFEGEPYELPDGRWVHLRGFGPNEQVNLRIAVDRDYL